MKKSDAVIRPATAIEIDAYSGYDEEKSKIVQYAEVLVEDGMMLAMGTLADFRGFPIVSLDITEEAKAHGVRMVLALRRWLKNNGGPVFAISHNPVLLSRLGFKRTELSINGKELWKWQNSQQ